MKLKNFLIESAYWLGMLVAVWLTVRSCEVHAQQRFSAPEVYHRVHPQTPDNGYVLYERNDSLFALFSNGNEKYLNVAHGSYEPVEKNTRHFRATMREVYNTPDSALYVSTGMIEYQPHDTTKIFGWITDSIKWVATDTTFEGDSECAHLFIFGETQRHLFGRHNGTKWLFEDGYSPLWCEDINPDGKHCNEHQSATREKICRKCLFSVIEREKWYQRYVAPPKSEFERFKEKQRAQQ